jgi:hypothetical protein
METWSFEKGPILLPDCICPRWKVSSKSTAEWINGPLYKSSHPGSNETRVSVPLCVDLKK